MSLINTATLTVKEIKAAYDKCLSVENAITTAVPRDVCGKLKGPRSSGVPFLTSGYFYIVLDKKEDTRRVVHALELVGFAFYDKDAVSDGSFYITMTKHFDDYFAIVAIQNAVLAGCSVVEEEVEVPARKERRFKVVCDDGATEL